MNSLPAFHALHVVTATPPTHTVTEAHTLTDSSSTLSGSHPHTVTSSAVGVQIHNCLHHSLSHTQKSHGTTQHRPTVPQAPTGPTASRGLRVTITTDSCIYQSPLPDSSFALKYDGHVYTSGEGLETESQLLAPFNTNYQCTHIHHAINVREHTLPWDLRDKWVRGESAHFAEGKLRPGGPRRGRD